MLKVSILSFTSFGFIFSNWPASQLATAYVQITMRIYNNQITIVEGRSFSTSVHKKV